MRLKSFYQNVVRFIGSEDGGLVRKSIFRLGALACMSAFSAQSVFARHSTTCEMDCVTDTPCQTLEGPQKLGIHFQAEGHCDYNNCWTRTWELEDLPEAAEVLEAADLLRFYIDTCDGRGETCNFPAYPDSTDSSGPTDLVFAGYETLSGLSEHHNALNMDYSSGPEVRAIHSHAIAPACPGQGIIWGVSSSVAGGLGDDNFVSLSCFCIASDDDTTEINTFCGQGYSATGEFSMSNWGWLTLLVGMPPILPVSGPSRAELAGAVGTDTVVLHEDGIIFNTPVNDGCDEDALTSEAFLAGILG